MYGLRQHRQPLLRLTLAVWLLTLLVTAFQGCLLQPPHDLASAHDAPSATQPADEHARHASGCLQHCSAAASAISPALQVPGVDAFSGFLLALLPALVVFNPGRTCAYALRRLSRRVPAQPPARLIFVRFND